MADTPSVKQSFPQYNRPFVDERRYIDRAWQQFLISLWNRTGGSQGDANLLAIEALTGLGLLVRTGDGTWTLRSIVGDSTSGLSVANGDGVDSDPIVEFLDQAANLILAGPATGSDAIPTFRSLVIADLPQYTFSVRPTGSLEGVLTNSQVLMNIPMKTGDALGINLQVGTSNSLLYCDTAPTADATFNLYKVSSGTPTLIATGVILASQFTGTWTAASPTTFSETTRDRLKLVAPSSADATLASVGWLITGTRTQ